jgi:hypothetical protein
VVGINVRDEIVERLRRMRETASGGEVLWGGGVGEVEEVPSLGTEEWLCQAREEERSERH